MTLLDEILAICPASGTPLSAYQKSPSHVVLLFKETQFFNFAGIFPRFSVTTDFAESRAIGSVDIHAEFDLGGLQAWVTCRIENPESSFLHQIETKYPSLMIFIIEILWNRSKNSRELLIP